MTVEIVGWPADGGPSAGQFHSTELGNVIASVNGAGVADASISATATGTNRVITFPAFNYWAPDGAGGIVYCEYAGGTVTMDADDTDPRTDIIVAYDDATIGEVAGVATPLSGDVVEAPMPDRPTNAILLAKVAIPADQGVVLEDNIEGRAITVGSQGGHVDEPSSIFSGDVIVERGGTIVAAATSTAWGTSEEAVFIPFVVTKTVTIKRIGVANGATAQDGTDVGIYDSDAEGKPQTLLASSPAAQSGTSQAQIYNITDTELVPGLYYMAYVHEGVTGTVGLAFSVAGDAVAGVRAMLAYSIYRQATARPLPATATPVQTAPAAAIPVPWMYLLRTA